MQLRIKSTSNIATLVAPMLQMGLVATLKS